VDPDRLGFDRAHLWHPYTSMADPQPVEPVAGADGVRLRLADGRELVDGMSSWWAAIHGYNHPALNAAVRAQLERMAHVMFGGLTHEPAIALGQRLTALLPAPLGHVFFCDSGSVAVEVAVKMVLQYWRSRGDTRRTRLVTVRGGYHGDTFAAMSVSDPDTGMHALWRGVLAEQLFAERPRCRFGGAWDPAAMDDVARLLDAHRDEVAAVILEPIVQGAGGMWFYHPRYLVELRRLCDAAGVLLVFDEIATGFGRTGALFAMQHAGVVPDVVCLGKALTGGYLTLAATVASRAVAEGISSGAHPQLMHGPTFMANPLACAVAAASIDLLCSGPWAERVGRIERQLRAELEPVRRAPGVADVRILGAIGVVEMDAPVDVRAAQRHFVARGVWVRPFGRLVYLMPPFVVGEDDLRRLTDAVVALVARGPSVP
jgi:adenosylmethionine-8-amino-7-oxononanoate aminotransferase